MHKCQVKKYCGHVKLTKYAVLPRIYIAKIMMSKLFTCTKQNCIIIFCIFTKNLLQQSLKYK